MKIQLFILDHCNYKNEIIQQYKRKFIKMDKECNQFIETVFGKNKKNNMNVEKKYKYKENEEHTRDQIWTIKLEGSDIYIITPESLKLGPPVVDKYDEMEEPSLIFNSKDSEMFFETKNESITPRIIYGNLVGPSDRFGGIVISNSIVLKPL